MLEKLQLKMNHIFKCPYHNHFLIDFKFFITNMLQELFSWVIYHTDFINSLITMQSPHSSNDITIYFHFDTTKWTCMGHVLFTKSYPIYLATIHLVLGFWVFGVKYVCFFVQLGEQSVRMGIITSNKNWNKHLT